MGGARLNMILSGLQMEIRHPGMRLTGKAPKQGGAFCPWAIRVFHVLKQNRYRTNGGRSMPMHGHV